MQSNTKNHGQKLHNCGVCGYQYNLYKTRFEIFSQKLERLAKLKQNILFISIPTQASHHRNTDIKKLNTKIMYETMKYKNIELVDTHSAFIKFHHLEQDGVPTYTHQINY